MKVLLAFSVFTLITMSIFSCKKAQPGCIDQKADNYNWQADEDDGTCSYTVEGVFYHQQPFSQALLDDDKSEINYYVDGQFIGMNIPNVYWDWIPDCGSTEAVGFSFDIGTNKDRNFNYILKDEDGFTLDLGNVTINGGDCLAIENK